jgi:hypothetical protein
VAQEIILTYKMNVLLITQLRYLRLCKLFQDQIKVGEGFVFYVVLGLELKAIPPALLGWL